jgi:hypothetical protein
MALSCRLRALPPLTCFLFVAALRETFHHQYAWPERRLPPVQRPALRFGFALAEGNAVC